jgi:hypothetical protein
MSDNFDWRDLRALGKLVGSVFFSLSVPCKERPMSRTPQVPPEQFVESVREEVDQYLKQVMEAVNQAPDGEWISGSDEKVRDIAAAMRQRIFEQAVQKASGCGGSRFSPLRTIRRRESGWRMGQRTGASQERSSGKTPVVTTRYMPMTYSYNAAKS